MRDVRTCSLAHVLLGFLQIEREVFGIGQSLPSWPANPNGKQKCRRNAVH